jgi:hypothetical protein
MAPDVADMCAKEPEAAEPPGCAQASIGTPRAITVPTVADAISLAARAILNSGGDPRLPDYEPVTEKFTSRVSDLFAILSVTLISSR